MERAVKQRHVLPGEDDGDTAWFYRQNSFEQQEILRQVGFKRRNWKDLADGRFSKRPTYTYPHILPAGHERLAFYEPLADAILSYAAEEAIAIHSEVLNLKSSQAACFNFLFPLRIDLDLANAMLLPLLSGLHKVIEIEFEYTGPPGVTQWLGEPRGGKRGQNRTSIDAAVFWNDNNGCRWATLIEWKYTERNFGQCGAFTTGSKADKALCWSLNVAKDEFPGRSRLLTTGGNRRSRHYWEHMVTAGISLAAFLNVQGCPFQGPFYQLLRQFLVAAYLRQADIVDEAEVVSMAFAGNTALHAIPRQLRSLAIGGPDSIVDVWNTVLRGVPPMRDFTVEQLMARVNKMEGIDLDWLNYLRERYDVFGNFRSIDRV